MAESVKSKSRAKSSGTEGISLIAAYTAISETFRANAGQVKGKDDEYSHISAKLIDALPPPSATTELEMRAVLQEVISGRLEWRYNLSDGRHTMVKNRIYDILDRHPEILSKAPKVSDLFGATGVKWLTRVVLPGDDNSLLVSELELLNFLKEKVSLSDSTVRELGKRDMRAKLLKSIPGIGPFFSVLILYEIDNVSRFSDERKLCAYAGLVPSTYASGGKTKLTVSELDKTCTINHVLGKGGLLKFGVTMNKLHYLFL